MNTVATPVWENLPLLRDNISGRGFDCLTRGNCGQASHLHTVLFLVFCNLAKTGAWNAFSSVCAASPSHRHPRTHFPPAPLLQYFALLLCIFLLEVLAGVLAYIYYQQVRPLHVDRLYREWKSPRLNPLPDLQFSLWTPVESPCATKDEGKEKETL